MKIELAELQTTLSVLLQHLEAIGVSSVELTQQYYWHVPTDSRYDPYTKPKELTLGDLSDDWLELQQIVDGRNEPFAYALVWLASVLRAIGENVLA